MTGADKVATLQAASTLPRPKRARLIDVAQRAGVTASVASRVLNDDPTLSVRGSTRDRIRNAAAQLGYRPHAGAQALAGGPARALALLIPDLTNPVFSRISQGAYHRALEHGYVILLFEDTTGHPADDTLTDLVQTGRVDGLLIASARPGHRLLASTALSDIPHVFVNREVPGSNHNVGLHLSAASALAVQHLHGLGHRRIGHVAGPPRIYTAAARKRGFATEARRLHLDASPVASGDFSEQGGATAATKLLAAHPDLTAIYASTLPQAVGVLHAIRLNQQHIPADISLIAYDDIALARYLDPPLTTIAMPLVELGAVAVDAIVDQLNGKHPQDHIVQTHPRLIERDSTAPPPPQQGR